jgi:hypothetical protein
MKKSLVLLFLLGTIGSYSQENGSFYGGFESNSQWYLNDTETKVSHPEAPLRSNNYLLVNYKYKNWAFGVQVESYEERALLNYNSGFDGTNVGTYFAQYKTDKVDVTLGYFYEQFGSGLLLRGWEDRALGINNSLRGGRVVYKPTSFLTFKGVYGQQRSGFEVSNGKIVGFDTEFSLSDLLKYETSEFTFGLSYVGRDELTEVVQPNFNRLTNAFAGRIAFSHNSFYATSEYNYKSEDAIVEVPGQIQKNFIKPGSAFLLNLGYSKKGFGIDASFRRIENMSFFSERDAKGNPYNDKIINFVPSLTKQHHNNLANIYVYQAQPNVILLDASLVKAGEIGGQIDVFYNFKKGSFLGGKNGTKVALNLSNWNALGGTFYISDKKNYDTDVLGFGEKYFSDYNLEISKKWNNSWLSSVSYINQYYNKKWIEETFGLVKTSIVAAETTYKFNSSKSIRVLGEHMWADSDKKNWGSATVECNLNAKWSLYVSDIYNYGNDDKELQHHYYNLGGAFRQKSTRIGINYGRQRGGLVCVGGVCRFVPESTGIAVSLNTTF